MLYQVTGLTVIAAFLEVTFDTRLEASGYADGLLANGHKAVKITEVPEPQDA